MIEVEVKHRQTGAAGETRENPGGSVFVELLDEKITAHELIRRSVQVQIRQLQRDGQLPSGTPEPAVAQQLFLRESDIEALAATGKIALTDKEPEPPSLLESAESRAIEAFDRGLFTILIGGRQIRSGDDLLDFEQQTQLVFLRLVPLVGG